ATESRARVHQKRQQGPTARVLDLVGRKAGRVGLIDGLDDRRINLLKAFEAAVVVVHDTGGRIGVRIQDVIGRRVRVAFRLAGVVIEAQVAAGKVRQVGQNIPLG